MALSRIRTLYSRHPVISNMCLYSGLFSAGELSVQTIQKRERYDWVAVGRLAIVGAGLFGPLYHVWYTRLDRFLPGNTASIVAKKVLLDQGLLGALGAFTFYASNSALEGKSKEYIISEAKQKWTKTYFTGWCYWPIVQMINFRFLPTHLRTSWVAVAAFLWTNFLCYLKSQKVTS